MGRNISGQAGKRISKVHSSDKELLLSPDLSGVHSWQRHLELLLHTCRLVMVRRRASSDSVDIGTANGESGMCSSLNLMEIS